MKKTISSFQAAVLLYTTIVPTAILVLPGVVMSYSGQDAWLSVAAATLAGIGFAVLVGAIASSNPGMSFQAWVASRFGRLPGLAVSLMLAFYYISTSAVVLRQFSAIVTGQILPRTPPYVVSSLVLLVAGYAVLSGIEVIARTNVFVTVISLAPYIVSMFLFSRVIQWERLFPVFTHKPAAILYGGLMPTGLFSEIAYLLILLPFLQDRSKAGKIALAGVLMSGLHVGVTIVLTILVYGPGLPPLYQYPSFSMIEVIQIGHFMERIDILFVAFWICTIYVKIAVFLFGAYHCFTEAFRLRPSRPILGILLLWILLTSSFAFQGDVQFSRLNRMGTPYQLLFFNVVLPLLIGLGLLFRKNRTSGEESVPCGTNGQG